MRRVAAIDCGTNSVRLLVADLPADGGAAVDLTRRMEIVRLGEGVDRTGRLTAAALERTHAALAAYAAEIRDWGAEQTRMVATSATRDAANEVDFTALVRETVGVAPEVISGQEEARLSFLGAVRDLPTSAPPPYLVVDVGGGSTELVTGTDTAERARSTDVGCVRITERHLHDDPPTADQVVAAEADVAAAVADAVGDLDARAHGTLVGLAGSVTTVAGIALGLREYRADSIHHARIPYRDVAVVADELLAMERARRLAIGVMHPGRADVIAAGALILRVVMNEVDAGSVVASEHDILDGIAWSLADRPTS